MLALIVTNQVRAIGAVVQKRTQAKVLYAYMRKWVQVRRVARAVACIQVFYRERSDKHYRWLRNSRQSDTGTIREAQRGCEQDTPSSSGELTSPPEFGVADGRTNGACAGRLQPDCQQSSEEENVEESTDKSSGNKQPQVPFSVLDAERPVPDDSAFDPEVLETVGAFSHA